VAVDTLAGTIKTYIDAQLVATVQSSKVTKDGQFALRGRMALFFKMQAPSPAHSIFYLRSSTVHARCLSSALAAQEHAMNQRLHIIDALRRAPAIHQPALQERHEREPFESAQAVVETLTQMHVGAHNKVSGVVSKRVGRDGEGPSGGKRVSRGGVPATFYILDLALALGLAHVDMA